jgi:hypothetical protein
LIEKVEPAEEEDTQRVAMVKEIGVMIMMKLRVKPNHQRKKLKEKMRRRKKQ